VGPGIDPGPTRVSQSPAAGLYHPARIPARGEEYQPRSQQHQTEPAEQDRDQLPSAGVRQVGSQHQSGSGGSTGVGGRGGAELLGGRGPSAGRGCSAGGRSGGGDVGDGGGEIVDDQRELREVSPIAISKHTNSG